jgi:hypothetical protein
VLDAVAITLVGTRRHDSVLSALRRSEYEQCHDRDQWFHSGISTNSAACTAPVTMGAITGVLIPQTLSIAAGLIVTSTPR